MPRGTPTASGGQGSKMHALRWLRPTRAVHAHFHSTRRYRQRRQAQIIDSSFRVEPPITDVERCRGNREGADFRVRVQGARRVGSSPCFVSWCLSGEIGLRRGARSAAN